MDLTFTITGAAAGAAILSIVVHFAKKLIDEKLAGWKAKREAFEAHIKECSEKKTHMALVDQKIDGIENRLQSGEKTFQWLGDCVVQIGAKLNAKLPERP